MRMWSVHPSHLDRAGLVACWRESLLAQAVLAGRTRGYRNHPQLERFRAVPDPVTPAVAVGAVEECDEACPPRASMYLTAVTAPPAPSREATSTEATRANQPGPRRRRERSRGRAARARQGGESSKKGGSAKGARGKGAKGSQSSQRGSGTDGAALPGTDLATLTVPGTKVLVPESTGRRELTTLDVVSGPLTTALAATSFGRAADERLAGTSTGETLIRVGQLLLGATGFVLVALGLASILGQVIS